MKKYPRESLTELAAVPTFSDPNQGQDADRLVQNMVKYILGGVAPVKDTPQLPPGYWERLQATAERRMTWLAAGSWTWSTPRPTRSGAEEARGAVRRTVSWCPGWLPFPATLVHAVQVKKN